MKLLGQVDLRHVFTAAATAVLLGGGGVIWSLIKPDPDRAIDYALMKQDVTLLKADVTTLKAQGTRIEAAIIRLEAGEGGVRTAGGKR